MSILNFFKPVAAASSSTAASAPAPTSVAGVKRPRPAEEAPSAAGSAGSATTGTADYEAVLAKYGASYIHESWKPVFGAEMSKPYFQKLHEFVSSARSKGAVFPPPDEVFSFARLTPLSDVRVVILAQDPYHGPGQAHGLALSVKRGIAVPPSLRNMLVEIQQERDEEAKLVKEGKKASLAPEVACTTGGDLSKPSHGNLEAWARQGVLLLNAVLTVSSGAANSHQGKGWEQFTDSLIRAVSKNRPHVVFCLWGKPAQMKASLVDRKAHTILEAPHPSPLSAHRGFFGCGHFKAANADLIKHGMTPINWDPSAVVPVAAASVAALQAPKAPAVEEAIVVRVESVEAKTASASKRRKVDASAEEEGEKELQVQQDKAEEGAASKD